MDNITQKIVKILKQIKPDLQTTISPSDDLFSIGVLDSFGMLAYITSIERKFDIQISNEELIPQNFWSIEATIKTIERIKK